jgi:diadenosine tetraphosphatase ApaH/serine/threonine PP2A family protein phosphatase
MREVCFCGRSGDVRDREPILDGDGRWALRCPSCGHPDYLQWLDEEAGLLLWGETRRRRGLSDERRYFAA